jgi:3-phenylpropionate/trans-cinnamate dioxygenase ferredoxin component
MSDTLSAGPAAEIEPGSSKLVHTDDDAIAVHNVDGTFYALSNICPHANGPLNQGFIEDGCISCPWHGWSFPLSPENPPRDGLLRYRITMDDGELFVHLPGILGTASSFD